MQYISDRFSRLTTFKRPRTESECQADADESSQSLETPQKRFKLDYAYNLITAPFSKVVEITKSFMEPVPAANHEGCNGASSPTPPDVIQISPTLHRSTSTSVSVQTTPAPLSTSDQRSLLRTHSLNRKSAISNVIQLEQREKYRQLLQSYTNNTNLSTSLISTSAPTSAPSSPLPSSTFRPRYITSSTPREARTNGMSPPSSDSGTGSGSEASGPVHQSKRMIKEPPKKAPKAAALGPHWTKNPFDDQWLKNWHKILSEGESEHEKQIRETKKSLDDAKLVSSTHQERLDILVSKALADDLSEDEAIEDVDSFPPLTPEMEAEIDRALRGGGAGETLIDAFNQSITRRDVNTLKDLTWLNDEVINFYFNLLMDRGKKSEPHVHVFSTFFYPRLLKVGHKGLARWTKKVDLFAMDVIMVPIHLGMHWCLAAIDIRAKTITYYDSLLGENQQCVKALRDYINAEHIAKKGGPLDLAEWKCVIEKDIPEQLNGCDCGVFTCKYAEYLSQDKSFDFDQSDMPYFRRRMIWEIVNKTLL